MTSWLWRWGPAALQMTLIFGASSIANLQHLPGDVSDKTGHFVGYAILGACVLWALASARWANVNGARAWQALAFSSLYGVSDEFHQHFVPGRSPAIDDWMADTLGAASAILVVLLVARLRPRRTGAAGAGRNRDV